MIVVTVIFSLILLGLIGLVMGSLLSLSSHPHWFVRGWDFPRIQIIALAWGFLGLFYLTKYLGGESEFFADWIFVSLTLFLTIWHFVRIFPYTVLSPKQAQSTSNDQLNDDHSEFLRIVISNVESENEEYAKWRQVISGADADILIVVEVDEHWIREVESVIARYPYRVIYPQDNWYGMMLLSRFPIERHELRFLVQKDVPSIDADIRLKNGELMRFVAVHPRPPEPIRDNDATARDAELMLWGEELSHEQRPVIIGGDLNDVAWSDTTRLFLRTSSLMDPRRGRGLFNTFNAKHFYMRFPLDHLFHSRHFTVAGIRRLPYVGSDHFPMQIWLRYEPGRKRDHTTLEEDESDQEEAEERIERAEHDESLNGDAVR